MSSSASLPSSTSSSSAPPAAAASAASTLVVAYELRIEGREPVAGVQRLGPTDVIGDLQQAVFTAARALLPERYSYLALDVYSPGSSHEALANHDRAARPRDSIASVLAKATVADDDTLIIVARPLPSIGGVQERHEHVPLNVRSVVGRLETAGGVASGVWIGRRTMLATHHQAVEGGPFYFYLLDRDRNEVTVREMRLLRSDGGRDIALFEQMGDARIDITRGAATAVNILHPASRAPITQYEPFLLPVATMGSDAGLPVFCLSFPASVREDIAEVEAEGQQESSSSSLSSSSSSQLPQWLEPVVTAAVVAGVGERGRVAFSHYLCHKGSSGGAVVAWDDASGWCLYGLHQGVVRPDLPAIELQVESMTEATSAAAESPVYPHFLLMTYAEVWVSSIMQDQQPNVQLTTKGQRRFVRPLAVTKRQKHSAARVGGDGRSVGDEQQQQQGEEEEEVLEVLEGWSAGWDMMYPPVPPLPLVIRGRTQSDPSVRKPSVLGRQQQESQQQQPAERRST